jgi:hypothetical protein
VIAPAGIGPLASTSNSPSVSITVVLSCGCSASNASNGIVSWNAAGQLRWTHVITVEPASDRGEPIGSERPFVLRPYRDVFGDFGAGVPRRITYREDAVPRGLVEVR